MTRGRVRVEHGRKRVRAYLAGELAADTTSPLLVWEVPYYPAYYIPAGDIRADLVPTGNTDHSPSRGDAEIFDLHTTGATARSAARRYASSPIAELRQAVRVDWDALDEWLEEDEPVYTHPATPTPGSTSWPAHGTSARNRAIDLLRRESRGRELLSEVAVLSPGHDDPGIPGKAGPVDDDRLRLIFTCCHPALSTEAQVALTLRLLGGLPTKEVARSFLVAEQTMAVRLVRAKRKIKAARIPYRVPEDHELPGRLRPVLAVVYLIYTAGLTSPAEPDLCPEAIRLARILATLMPGEPEGGRAPGAAAADRIPPCVPNAARRLPGAARRAGPQTMGPGPD